MATVYRCDRCRDETEDRDKIYQFRIPLDYDNESTSKHDLCESCLKEVRKFVQPLAQQAERK